MEQSELMKKIMEIQRDPTLSDAEKAVKRQQLMAGKWAQPAQEAKDDKGAAILNRALLGGERPSGFGLCRAWRGLWRQLNPGPLHTHAQCATRIMRRVGDRKEGGGARTERHLAMHHLPRAL